MHVYDLFHGLHPEHFARADPHADMYSNVEYCHACGVAAMVRNYPMKIEWTIFDYEIGSDMIADFTWIGPAEVAVTDRVRNQLSQSTGLSYGPVEMWQNPKLKRPKRETSRTKRRIWLPYEGPRLWDFIVIGRGEADFVRSGWQLRFQCPSCGEYAYTPVTNESLIFPKDRWDGSDFFLDRNRSRWTIFCTENGKALLDQGHFTNLNFKHRGMLT